MALLNLSRNDIHTWLVSQKINKPLQDMTESEIRRATETFKIPRAVLLQIINATEFDAVPAPSGPASNRLEGGMKQTPNPQRGVYDGEQ